MRSSSLFSPMAAVRRPSPHRSLAAVLLSLRALTGKPGSSGREEGCREGEGRKAMGGSTVAARRDMRNFGPKLFRHIGIARYKGRKRESEPWLEVGKRVKTEERCLRRVCDGSIYLFVILDQASKRRKKDDIMVATVWKPTKTKARASSSLNDYNECKKERVVCLAKCIKHFCCILNYNSWNSLAKGNPDHTTISVHLALMVLSSAASITPKLYLFSQIIFGSLNLDRHC
uniref:Uncharacterized protein n=1 Tax=Oryza barthii TaxID=65489 RepID=A0A0D3FM92_9ORYZ